MSAAPTGTAQAPRVKIALDAEASKAEAAMRRLTARWAALAEAEKSNAVLEQQDAAAMVMQRYGRGWIERAQVDAHKTQVEAELAVAALLHISPGASGPKTSAKPAKEETQGKTRRPRKEEFYSVDRGSGSAPAARAPQVTSDFEPPSYAEVESYAKSKRAAATQPGAANSTLDVDAVRDEQRAREWIRNDVEPRMQSNRDLYTRLYTTSGSVKTFKAAGSATSLNKSKEAALKERTRMLLDEIHEDERKEQEKKEKAGWMFSWLCRGCPALPGSEILPGGSWV